ncbi:MAG: DUF3863 domain-containing protein [Candidatus Aminicenantes bacterium]|nr:DUF3863 domain-containing protein [Candidatus Aminicenantes bacterium]
MDRREFMKKAGAGIIAAGALPGPGPRPAGPIAPAAAQPLDGRRILTFNSVIRVNQIEVTRTRNEGFDEADRHTPENVRALRDALAAGWPGAPMTWAFSWRALFDERENYRRIREIIPAFHEKYGDDVTFIPGAYFANAYNTRDQVDRDLHDGLSRVSEIMGGGFRPKSVIAGFLAAANQKYLAEREGIRVCQGNIWSQYAVDNQDGEGSISYPYYPSTEHFCKPAQGAGDFIDCVNLDGWTCDFLAARRQGQNWAASQRSRMGVGPIETIEWFGPEVGLAQIVQTTAAHFDTGFALNGWAWVTNCWEISLVPQIGHLEVLTRWTKRIRERWPSAECLTLGDFGSAFRDQYPNNDNLRYRFVQKGTGVGGSEVPLEIRWFMCREFRLALLRSWRDKGPERVIDFTRYDLPAREPRDLTRRWSLMGRINQKGTRPQDEPVPFGSLASDERALIQKWFPELKT